MISEYGMLYRSVSIQDVKTVLGEDSNYLRTLCRSDSINKWARYKPISYPSVGVITEANRKSKNYGLFCTENTAAKTFLLNATKTEEDFNSIKGASHEWGYNKPTGGTNSPYRLSDFVLEEQEGGTGALHGYKQDARPPFEIREAVWKVSYAELSSIADTYFVENDNSNQYNWSIKIYSSSTGSRIYAGKQFYDYRMKYDEAQPQYDINSPDNLAIPMKSLFLGNTSDSQNIDDLCWRIGMIVYVPSTIPSAGLFVSQKTMYNVRTGVNGSNVQYLSVDMCTNQELALAMKRYIENNSNVNQFTFRALPVLVKNAKIGYAPAQSQQPTGFIGQSWHGQSKIINEDVKIYPLPTGSTEISIIVDKEDESVEPPRIYGDFELSVIPVGRAEPYVDVSAIAIISKNSIEEAKSAEIDIDYTIYDVQNEQEVGTTRSLTGTYTIPKDASFHIDYNNTYYKGIDLRRDNAVGRKLSISKVRTFTVT